MTHFRKWFLSYLEVKNKCFERLKMGFFIIMQIFQRRTWKKLWNLFKQKFIMKRVLENRFGATLTSKGNVLSILKVTFFTFFKFSCDEVKIIFWESKAKLSNLFKSKVSHGYRFRKRFRSSFEVQNEDQIFWFFSYGIFLFFANF